MKKAGVWHPHNLRGVHTVDTEVLVIGSGAGGATMAAELAEAGMSVAVVEEGGYYQTEDFSADPTKAIRTLYRDAGSTVAIGNPPVLYQEGSCVGGSTVINGAMSWRTPPRILEHWQKQLGIEEFSPTRLEPFFERVEKRIHVAPQDPETIGTDNALLKRGADALGWKVIGNLRNQVHCAGSNNCAFGCPTGAKQSALVTYVERALHFGAQIYSRCRVDKILWKRKRAIGATATVVNGNARHRIRFRAKLVVVACGAIHTPALLSRSGYKHKHLGRNLSLHPNAKVVAIYDEPIRGWEGVHQAYQVREFQDDGLVFAAVNVPPSIVALSLPFVGQKLGEMMQRYDHMMVAGLLTEDSSTGSVRTLPGGKPQAFYGLNDPDFSRIKRGLSLLGKLLFTTGAQQIILPFEGAPVATDQASLDRAISHSDKRGLELLTVHMMGTLGTGRHIGRGVVSPTGELYDAANLIVADASVFPTPIGVNPAETIQALSTHHAAHIIDNQQRYLS